MSVYFSVGSVCTCVCMGVAVECVWGLSICVGGCPTVRGVSVGVGFVCAWMGVFVRCVGADVSACLH